MLNFMEHISSQLKKAYAKTGALMRSRRFVPMDVMLALYVFHFTTSRILQSPPVRGGESPGR